MKYENQKRIVIEREQVKKGSKRIFLCAYFDNIEDAMKILSKSAFQTYIYLLSNADGYKLDASPTHISKVCNMSAKTAQKTIRELEEKGYLTQDREKENTYYFNEKISRYRGKLTLDELENSYYNLDLSGVWR